MNTQSRSSLHKRARIRAFLAEGVEKLLLSWTVETLPSLLHISLFLFFAGLVVFLWNVDLTIFKLVLSWVGICTALYGCITVMPIFRYDSPYITPLSLPVWHIVTGIPYLTLWALKRLALRFRKYFGGAIYVDFRDLARTYGKRLAQGMQKTIEEAAMNSPSEIDTRALLWTLDSLDEDHELERFFSGLPGFWSSKLVEDSASTLAKEGAQRLFTALTGLLDRSFSSDLLPDPVRCRRAIICAKLIDPTNTTEAFSGLNINRDATADAKATFSTMVARLQPRDDIWFLLASKLLGVPKDVLRGFASHGDSLSLAVLIHLTRLQFDHYGVCDWPTYVDFSTVLEEASEFNVQDTLPELQHQFCALWNQIVRRVHNKQSTSIAFFNLGRIRNVYLALHQGTDSAPTEFSASTVDDHFLYQPSSYPVCSEPGHHPDSTSHIHDDSAPISLRPAVLHDNAGLLPASLAGTPHAPSPPVLAPLHADDNLIDVPLLENNMSVSVSFHPAHQTTMERLRRPIPDSAAAGATRDTETFLETKHLFQPEPLAFAPLPNSQGPASPPDAVAIENTTVGRTLSLNVPSSPSPTQVLPPGPPLTSDSPVTELTTHLYQNLIR